MKIFLGCDDIASILSGLAEGFKDMGHSVTTFVFEKNKFYPDINYDIVFHTTKKTREKSILKPFTKIAHWLDSRQSEIELKQKTKEWINEFDLFVFVWRPWLDEKELFKEIKLADKKIICIHTGSDVRHISAYKQQYNEDVKLWEHFFHMEDLNEKIRKIRLHELYADAIFSVPDQAGLAIRPYNHLYLPISKNKKIICNIPARKVPLLVHAPSRSGIKGSSLIMEVVDRLKHEGYQFTFELIQNMANTELIKKLEDADILVDEVLLHGPGVLSSEAMLAGCAVATRTLKDYKEFFDPPVVSIDPDNMYSQLRFLLDNITFRIDLAEKGKQFAMIRNNPSNIAKQMIHDLKRKENDYIPRFYIEQYRLPGGVNLNEGNKKLSEIIAKKYYSESLESIERSKSRGLL